MEYNEGGDKDNIVLVTGDKIISDTEVMQTFNDLFKNSVKSLNISENKLLKLKLKLQLKLKLFINGAEKAIKRFEIYPSIIGNKKI